LIGSNEIHIAEMNYYATIRFTKGGVQHSQAIALASLYGPKDETLYKESCGTYWTAQHLHKLVFIPVKNIRQLVMMAPDPCYGLDHTDGTEKDRWYMMQKPGAGLFDRLGFTEEEQDDVDGNQDD